MGPANRQFFHLSPPIAGQPAVLACSTVAGVVDLTTIGNLTPAVDKQDVGATNKLVRLYADGGDVYVNFGPTLASVTGGNVPNPATQTAVNGSGVVTLAAGACVTIPKGGYMDFHVAANGSRFVGFVVKASVTANLQAYPVSQ